MSLLSISPIYKLATARLQKEIYKTAIAVRTLLYNNLRNKSNYTIYT